MPQQRLREATTTWMAPEQQRGEETEHRPPGGSGPAASGASLGLPAPQCRAQRKAGRGRRFMTEADGATGGSACHWCSAGSYHAGNEVTLEQTPQARQSQAHAPARQTGCADWNMLTPTHPQAGQSMAAKPGSEGAPNQAESGVRVTVSDSGRSAAAAAPQTLSKHCSA